MARKNLSKLENVEVKYDSIYDNKYENEFDIVFSIGVIHHLEDPEKAVINLTKAVKKQGLVLLWVYGYEGNEWIVRYINPIRRITSRLPLVLTNLIAFLFTIPMFMYLKLIPQKHPYTQQLSDFGLQHIHNIILDQLIPEIAHYWKKHEAFSLLTGKGLRDIKIFHVNSNSWTVVGIKE